MKVEDHTPPASGLVKAAAASGLPEAATVSGLAKPAPAIDVKKVRFEDIPGNSSDEIPGEGESAAPESLI